MQPLKVWVEFFVFLKVLGREAIVTLTPESVTDHNKFPPTIGLVLIGIR